MQVRGRKRAAALAAAVIGGLIGGAPGAYADPPGPGLTAPNRETEATLPSVYPRPHSLLPSSGAVPVGERVFLLADEAADPYAIEALRTLLRDAGARQITEVTDAAEATGPGLLVRAGQEPARTSPATLHTRTARAGTDAALSALKVAGRGDLPSGGYRIGVGRVEGRDTVALAGIGGDGLFHAVQTLRQLAADGSFAGVRVRDWPASAVRGTTEGFYGTPWTTQERLEQLDFMGRTKQNRYVYAPGDDLYRQAKWREPYPAAQRAEFRKLAERARANHVTLGWAVAPGQAMCLSSDDDLKALVKKIDAMWALGARAFQLHFQDVSYSEWHCDQDAETFGSGPEAAAEAQARVANAVAKHLAARHPSAPPLTLMPTEYYQEGSTAYRKRLAKQLNDGVQVAWTGVGVVPKKITGSELSGARRAFGGHDLVTMDNYPVNDYAEDRIFLGPYTGREPAVATGSAALLANAMQQPTASRIPLFTAADYAWNPRGYQPGESWRAAIADLAGPDPKTREAVAALAGHDASSVLGARESAYLRPLIEEFFTARATSATDSTRLDEAGRRLTEAFAVMRQTPGRLDGTDLGQEVRPWTEQLGRYGEAGELAVEVLLAQARGQGEEAWRSTRRLDSLRAALGSRKATVGEGVLDAFLDRVQEEAAAWTGAGRAAVRKDAKDEAPSDRSDHPEDSGSSAAPEGSRDLHDSRNSGDSGDSPGSRGSDRETLNLPRPRPVDRVSVMTVPGARGTLQAHVPGKGWRSLGAISESGWTEAPGPSGERVDALRVLWQGERGRVEHIVPWYADGPDAWLKLSRTEVDVETGGAPQRIAARLTAQRPDAVRGRVTAEPPAGIEVRTPRESTLPRGTEVDVPVEITVPAGTPSGTYEIPVHFGSQTRTLTVRANPPVSGPDLARSGKASSSADETPDFPASAANDGDPRTRWSSPAEDGAWWQTEFATPVRLGRVVLSWQDAHPSRYRVQVSSDGRVWRTAATVRDGRGGREAVGLDAREVRFVRVQTDKRATEYGVSLWSVEAYAVAE
ncbi:beta-N-acetylglucosaminidase domain-containing protein [Streptomyces sp. TRM66268-LWL]|uniref:Beta-N-acetylglucosaminidase domain-containing protein n=1 Tax=Streptomyces polyasparticus TaxID=2767826 RepID=A0ABR7SRF1_9ACTN|nr:beta-N-acetylglucosaminidase domain-containing protein [Streptomyces polyasparticus]MBC9718081.1 beta-N-acetylglucosaminidase domain-containing protein [Streptomyces polyasparticus]